MRNELLLIIGPPASGKSWLADAIIDKCYTEEGNNPYTFEEADLNNLQHIAEIKDHVKNSGSAIVVCSLVTSSQLRALAPDRIYSIGIKQTR